MINSLYSLWHNSIVGCDNYYGNICDLCTACSHGSKGLVARCIEECYLPSVIKCYPIGSDMLCDTTGFTCNNICSSYVIEELCFPMIYMSHYSNNRRSWFEIFCFIINLAYCIKQFSADKFDFISEFIGKKSHSLSIEPLVNRDKETKGHAC